MLSLILTLLSTTLLLIGTCLTAMGTRPAKLMQTLALLAGFSIIGLTALEWISNQFTGTGFDDSVVYHFRYGFEGAGLREFLVRLGVDALLLVVTTSLFLWGMTRRAQRPLRLPVWTGAVFLLIGLVVHPTLPKLISAATAAWMPRPPVEATLSKIEGYVAPALPAYAGTGKPPNIVWLYAESLERTYMDETLFPGLTPELHKLESEALSLTNLTQVSGASWTVGGMVASQCGVPLTTGGAPKNSLDTQASFLPRAVCLGDLLATQGYHLHYSAGAVARFAGKGTFYQNHGFESVRGRNEFEKILPKDTPMNSWGLYDTTLFKQLAEEFSTLLTTQQPFGLFSLTLETHGLAGHSCGDLAYRDGAIEILNSVHCSDRLIGELVRELRRRDTTGNTLIIVTSDHLARPNPATVQMRQEQRRNLALYLWPGRIKPAKNDHAHSTLDTGATALRLMGFPINALAFGRAVGGTQASLAELPNLEARMIDATPSLLALWDLPGQMDSLVIRPQLNTAFLNDSPQRLPLMIGLREGKQIQKLFSPDERTKLTNRTELLAMTSECTDMKWIERCERMTKTLGRPVDAKTNWCLWDWKTDSVKAIDGALREE